MMRIAGILLTILLLTLLPAGADEIHDAAIRGDMTRIRSIVKNDPHALNAKTPNGETPLHLASRQGRLEVVEFLISNGADVNAQDRNSETPLHEATVMNHKEVAAFLLSHGADINAKDKNGTTPLKLAISIGNREIVELLKSRGARE